MGVCRLVLHQEVEHVECFGNYGQVPQMIKIIREVPLEFECIQALCGRRTHPEGGSGYMACRRDEALQDCLEATR